MDQGTAKGGKGQREGGGSVGRRIGCFFGRFGDLGESCALDGQWFDYVRWFFSGFDQILDSFLFGGRESILFYGLGLG